MASVSAGLLGGAYGLSAHGADFWATLGWYAAGCWGGFAVMLGLVLLAGMQRQRVA